MSHIAGNRSEHPPGRLAGAALTRLLVVMLLSLVSLDVSAQV